MNAGEQWMPGNNDDATLPLYEVRAEALLSHRANGLTVPTLTIAARTNKAQSSLRLSHAMAFWGAAYSELLLERMSDHFWAVGNPQPAKREQLEHGWWSWVIYLESHHEGANVELGLRLLRCVVRALGEVFACDSAKKLDLH
jgi:hypothetical protein